jgi:hypothetical protein
MICGRLDATQQREQSQNCFLNDHRQALSHHVCRVVFFFGDRAKVRHEGNLNWSESSPDCLLAD